jgi:hypothetical protein
MARPGDASRKLLAAIGLSVAIASFTAVVWLGFTLESGWIARVAVMFVAAVIMTMSERGLARRSIPASLNDLQPAIVMSRLPGRS